MVVEAGVELLKFQGKTPTNSDLIRFAVAGWCIEFMQAFLYCIRRARQTQQLRPPTPIQKPRQRIHPVTQLSQTSKRRRQARKNQLGAPTEPSNQQRQEN